MLAGTEMQDRIEQVLDDVVVEVVVMRLRV